MSAVFFLFGLGFHTTARGASCWRPACGSSRRACRGGACRGRRREGLPTFLFVVPQTNASEATVRPRRETSARTERDRRTRSERGVGEFLSWSIGQGLVAWEIGRGRIEREKKLHRSNFERTSLGPHSTPLAPSTCVPPPGPSHTAIPPAR